MLMIAVAAFALAALLGVFLLSYVLRGKIPPTSIALMHGPAAAVGIIILVYYIVNNTSKPLLNSSAIIFILAALGGLTLISRALRGKPVPKMMAIGHGVTALVAFMLLLIALFY